MHRFISGLAAVAVLACTSPPAIADDAAGPTRLSPQQIGDIFCIARLGNDMAPVEAIITPSLKRAIAEAEKLNTAWEKKNPGEKPPLGDGLPWQTAPDYAPVCIADHASYEMDAARVSINYSFPDAPDADFVDILHLTLVADPRLGDKLWRIDDVFLSNGDTMRQQMLDAFR